MSKTIKTRAGRVLLVPDAQEDAQINQAAWLDPDAHPLTEDEWRQAQPLMRRGRPLGSGTKTQVTLRLDTDVLESFKATGAGWQTRLNDALKSWHKQHA
jgi:uncharacterized protein (DUF4415 family)